MIVLSFILCKELAEKINKHEENDHSFQEIDEQNEIKLLTADILKKRWNKLYERLIKLCKKYPQLVDEEGLKRMKSYKDVRFKNRVKVRSMHQLKKMIKRSSIDLVFILIYRLDSKYPAIDEKVCEFVNKKREVPSFQEVFDVAEQTNKSCKLNIKYVN